jgi:hypothetical protein
MQPSDGLALHPQELEEPGIPGPIAGPAADTPRRAPEINCKGLPPTINYSKIGDFHQEIVIQGASL